MDVCIDCSVNADDIGTDWFALDAAKGAKFDGESLKPLVEKLNRWSTSSAIETNACKFEKAFALAFALVKDKENGRFVKRHLKEIHFVDKIVGSAVNIDNFKNELNSLRNQYVHEGYYLPNNQFAVNGKGKVFLYHKTMDYNWLLRIVKVFKFGVYKIQRYLIWRSMRGN